MNLCTLIAAISVLTWNTARMGGFEKPDKNEVLQHLLQQDADVICLQEVDVYKDARYLTLGDMKNVLSTKYPYSYIDFSVYDKRHQFGTMVWAKYPLINKKSIHYETRGNLSNRCDIVVGKDTIRLFNNHLESYSFTSEDFEDMDRIEAKWKRAIPLRNEQARGHISRGLHDAWNTIHPWSWGATFEYRGIGVRIDYILCSDPLIPVDCSVQAFHGSDHRPVSATLEW